MNAVGIDVSKGKSMVAVMRPFGEVIKTPFEVSHTEHELEELASFLLSLDGETRVIMEYTGKYYEPVARYLHNAGLFVSVVHAMLVHNYGKTSIRRVKTDKADALKIANYGLDRWTYLTKYTPEHDTRLLLKAYNRQYHHYIKLKVMLKNNLISLLDQTYPDVNTLFSSKPRKDGHEKWVDFAAQFWHRQCVCGISKSMFQERYAKWCRKAGYHYSSDKADEIYEQAHSKIDIFPKDNSTKELLTLAIAQLNTIAETLAAIQHKMLELSSELPEYFVVMDMRGVGEILGPQLMAELGDIRRFTHKGALVAFAGLDAPPFQSGQFESHNRSISKRGPSTLRKTLFQVMDVLLKTAPADDPVFQFLDRKRTEGKHYYVYMMAGANKFLRIYYARIKEHLEALKA